MNCGLVGGRTTERNIENVQTGVFSGFEAGLGGLEFKSSQLLNSS